MGIVSGRKLLLGAPRFYRAKSKLIDLESLESQPPGTLRACPGVALPYVYTFFCQI